MLGCGYAETLVVRLLSDHAAWPLVCPSHDRIYCHKAVFWTKNRATMCSPMFDSGTIVKYHWFRYELESAPFKISLCNYFCCYFDFPWCFNDILTEWHYLASRNLLWPNLLFPAQTLGASKMPKRAASSASYALLWMNINQLFASSGPCTCLVSLTLKKG